MLVKRIKLFSVLFFIINSCVAQTSGYLGKKTFIGISGGLVSNYSGILSENQGVKYNGEVIDNYFSFSPTLNFSIKRVISNNATLDLMFTRTRNGVYRAYNMSDGIEHSDRTNGNLFDYQRARSNIFTIAFTETGATSPIGNYISYGTSIMITKMEALDVDHNVYKLKDYNDISLYFATGIRKVYYDKLLVDFGLDFNLYYYGFLKNFVNKSDNSTSNTQIEENYPYTVMENNFVSCRLGVSYLF